MYRYLVLFLGGAALGYFGAKGYLLLEKSFVREGLVVHAGRPFATGKSEFDSSQTQELSSVGRDPWRALNEEFEASLPALPQEYALCNAAEEAQARRERESCLAAPQKAPQFWKSLDDAEAQTIALLQLGNLQEISKYIACDAQDLTWYELHCLADIVKIRGEHIEDMLEFADARVLAEARWTREVNPEHVSETPEQSQTEVFNAGNDRSRVGNTGSAAGKGPRSPAMVHSGGSAEAREGTLGAKPTQELATVQSSNQWKARSRLISQSLRIGAPWSPEEQAQESRTLILLEEKKDGRVYLSGVPVTGIEKTRNQSLY